jgi:hypothetical protein
MSFFRNSKNQGKSIMASQLATSAQLQVGYSVTNQAGYNGYLHGVLAGANVPFTATSTFSDTSAPTQEEFDALALRVDELEKTVQQLRTATLESRRDALEAALHV